MSGNALVWGGAGQLGGVIVDALTAGGFAVTSVDLRENAKAAKAIVVGGKDAGADAATVLAATTDDYAFIVCVAGGWCGETVASTDVFANAEKMWAYNVRSSLAVAHVATKKLAASGLLLLTGAEAALKPTPTMLAYGVSKAATHHIVRSLAAPGGGLAHEATQTVAAMLPICLDTPQNRSGMPDADFKQWTPLDTLAQKLVSWGKGEDRPKSGSLVVVKTTDGETSYEVAA